MKTVENMTVEGTTITVNAEDVLSGKVTVDEVVGKIFEVAPSLKIEILELADSPMSVEVNGNLTPYTLETMPDDFTKRDVVEYNKKIEEVKDFVQNVYDNVLYSMLVTDDLIRKVIVKNNPILNDKDVDTIIMYSNEYTNHSERVSMIDTFTDIATEILQNHEIK